MSDVLVKVEGVSKKFCKTLNRSMLYGMKDITGNMLGKAPDTGRLRPGEFWSVDDVSFEVRRGECLGLIGPNGAGKSTLLKLLNGIISPDKGRIEIQGRVGALIEVTAGFHPMLTGRENIYINGAILGFSKKEIDKKFEEIVEFSELGDFIDSPVKHYSSGMYVRLGFSIATQMEPDVLLIDEVMAVGDIGFRTKCINAMAKILRNSAVIFVSHDMPQVARTCSDICVLNHGKISYVGRSVSQGMEHYYSNFNSQQNIVTGNGKASIKNIGLESNGKYNVAYINSGHELIVNIDLIVAREIRNPIVFIGFLNRDLQLIAQCSSLFNNIKLHNLGDSIHLKIRFQNLCFNPGTYVISVSVLDESQKEILTYNYAIKEFKVTGDFVSFAPILFQGEWEANNTHSIERLT